jgi:glutathione peroxidase
MYRIFLSACAALVIAYTSSFAAEIKSLHDVTMNAIDGKPAALSQYKGSVVLLVNVASKCGNTKQYAQLEALYDTYKERGLVVLGVPANNFKGQEPGTNEEIATFCKAKYDVSFPLLAKVSVKGDDICPLYKYLTTSSAKPGEITWNFEKFLIGRDGQVIERFTPKTIPNDPSVIAALEAALAAK